MAHNIDPATEPSGAAVPPGDPDNLKNRLKNIAENAEQRGASAASWIRRLFRVSREDTAILFASQPDTQGRNMAILFALGVLLTPVTLIGMLLGWVRTYNRFDALFSFPPNMSRIPAIYRFAMVIGAALAWVYLIGGLALLMPVMWAGRGMSGAILTYLFINLALSGVAFGVFRIWWARTSRSITESRKFGSARFANEYELEEYRQRPGFYIGGGMNFSDHGHLLTVAGTRGGKGTNVIIPNLLGMGGYDGSWVITDVKAENYAITARYQRESGKRVIALNPWQMLGFQSDSFNPLDMLTDRNGLHLVDDVKILAEMIVPVKPGESDPFFTDTARSIIEGFLLYLIVEPKGKKRELTTIWEWARLTGDDWEKLVASMRTCTHKVYGKVVANAGNELVRHSTSADTFGSIMSNVLIATDFIKSPAIQQSMKSGFDPYSLADGNTCLYIIIPADKLDSHSRWLRLVVSSLIKAILRKPGKRVAFMLDEFAALGYLSEIKTGMGAYAGYNITLWPILQSLNQIKAIYGDWWQDFVANTAVKQYFSIHDNFSANYISEAIGNTSNVTADDKGEASANARPLITPDELRRASGGTIFAFIDSNSPTYFDKLPYYLIDGLRDRWDENPYRIDENKL